MAPQFFRDACKLASRGKRRLDYSHPGRELMLRIESLRPAECDAADWTSACQQLYSLCAAGDRAGILAWFKGHVPKCIGLMRTPAYKKFVDGVLQAWSERTES